VQRFEYLFPKLVAFYNSLETKYYPMRQITKLLGQSGDSIKIYLERKYLF